MSGYPLDLVVLVADKDMKETVEGLLSRPKALGTRAITRKVHSHPQHDPSVLKRGHEFVRPMTSQASHALLLFDRKGCGHEQESRESLERKVEENLFRNGWDERAACIVLDPELEMWIWSDSPKVEKCLGWEGQRSGLRQWLARKELWPPKVPKPPDPKEAMEKALRRVKRPWSSSIHREIAGTVGFSRCTDPAFRKFRRVLRDWFPVRKTPRSSPR